MILHPLYLAGGSLVLAGVLAMVMLSLLRLFGRRPAFQFSATVSLVLLTVAAATMLKLSVALSLLLLGMLGRLFDHERHFVSLKFGETAMLFIVLLFALAGASLDFAGWLAAAPLALAFVAARLLGKAVPILLLSWASGLRLRKSSLVSVALMPMSGLALLMLHELMQRSPASPPRSARQCSWQSRSSPSPARWRRSSRCAAPAKRRRTSDERHGICGVEGAHHGDRAGAADPRSPRLRSHPRRRRPDPHPRAQRPSGRHQARDHREHDRDQHRHPRALRHRAGRAAGDPRCVGGRGGKAEPAGGRRRRASVPALERAAESSTSLASGRSVRCTATLPSSSPFSASTCTSAAPTATPRCT